MGNEFILRNGLISKSIIATTKSSNIATSGRLDDLSASGTSFIKLTGASGLSGVSGNTDGKYLIITNGNSDDIDIFNNSEYSTVDNRILTGIDKDITLKPDASIFLIYDDDSSKWRVVGGTGSGGMSNYVAIEVGQTAHGFDLDFVYHNGTQWVKALADTEDNCATHLAVRKDDNNFEAVIIGEVDITGLTDESGNSLTAGEYYFLSDLQAGKVTTSTTSYVRQPVLKVNTSTSATISIELPFATSDDTYDKVHVVGHGFDGDFVYSDGNGWVKAIATSIDTCATHFAIRIDDDNFELKLIDDINLTGITDDTGTPLVPGSIYYLSQMTAGKVTSSKPTLGICQRVLKMGELGYGNINMTNPFVINSMPVYYQEDTVSAGNTIEIMSVDNAMNGSDISVTIQDKTTSGRITLKFLVTVDATSMSYTAYQNNELGDVSGISNIQLSGSIFSGISLTADSVNDLTVSGVYISH